MKTIKDNVIESCTHWIEECKMNKVPTPTRIFYEDVITILREMEKAEPVYQYQMTDEGDEWSDCDENDYQQHGLPCYADIRKVRILYTAPQPALVATVNAELLEASKDFVERVNKNIYPKPDKPKSDWAILQNLIAAIKQAEQSK